MLDDRAHGARRDRLPAADRRARGARGRLARARARARSPTSRCSTASRASRSTTASSQVGAEPDDGPPRDLRGRRHGARRADGDRRRRATARRPRATSTHGSAPAPTMPRPSTSSPRSRGSTPGTTRTRLARCSRQLELARRRSTFEEVVGGLDETTAVFEARRCLSCGNCFDCDNCFGVCPDNSVLKLEGKDREAAVAVRVRLRLLQGLRDLRRRVPVRRDRDGARDDLRR